MDAQTLTGYVEKCAATTGEASAYDTSKPVVGLTEL